MPDPIQGLKPEAVWKYFAQVVRIPRCSKHEEAIRAYLLKTAKALGLEVVEDKCGNVVVRKPASKGREQVRSVVLQGHMDMVCEKNKDKKHDFSKDPIQLVRKDNVLMANGTTLGADNGIAVATNLAIMADKSLEHGPLEFLFTVDEETGLTGASNLSGELLQSRTLINLDSEEEGALYVGCSGGRDTRGSWAAKYDPAPSGCVLAQLKVLGLKGGHSGLEIDKGRGNAIKIINRVLLVLHGLGARVCSIEGGNKHNAIPRETEALLLIPDKKWEQAAAAVAECQAVIKSEFSTMDPDLAISLERRKGKKPKVFRKAMQKKILQTLSAIPHGVTKMSADIPGLVETSTNLAVIKSGPKAVEVVTSQRSSVASEIQEVCHTVESVLELGGAAVAHGDGYPGWKPNLDSYILKTAVSTYESLFQKPPLVKAIHAGLECGIIGEKCPGMDMVSMGPTLEGVHSPDEKIYIDTVEKYWNLLLAVLKNMQ